MEIRDAVKADAKDLAYLINMAGEGIPEYLWKDMVEGSESPLQAGARRAAREAGNFSYTNARVCEENGALLGMVLSYRQPDPYAVGDLSEYPEILRPVLQLEAKLPGSWYINAIATYAQYRGRGVAHRLCEDTVARARANDCFDLSLIVASENAQAMRLYERLGFQKNAALPIVPYPGGLHAGDWVLMSKHIET